MDAKPRNLLLIGIDQAKQLNEKNKTYFHA